MFTIALVSPVLKYWPSKCWFGKIRIPNSVYTTTFEQRANCAYLSQKVHYWLKNGTVSTPSYRFPITYNQKRYFTVGSALFEKRPFEVNTNVQKDIILFKYENTSFFKWLNIFGICQFIFWSYLSYSTFTTLRDVPVKDPDENLPWWRKVNLGDPKYKNTIAALCFGLGYLVLAAAWLYSLKTVRFLILRQGGEKVAFVTYGPFGRNRIIDIPLNKVSCEENRQTAKILLPLKVEGHYMYYMLDMRGEFRNAQLFDYTAGIKRNIK